MKLHVSEEAATWYKNELDIEESAQIRFYVRYGGVGGNIPGFSLALKHDIPNEADALTKKEDITFFIESKDEWYFEGKDLNITLNKDTGEPEFTYA
ncbi:HesB/YadR/YfhF family protein [Virgibacillus alimentarius]|uniref:Uncharacterized protein YneR n=1 Tax=Virgibacillus alimentarius TaxID=698769 RepID=A0ABS4S7A5_9BACI|nr:MULTISPECIES: HesB/YadR/YfhF family protein [Virgibacillus]MBP2256297.1 uncharacterized protein YneR [Virgibacillus alimentarius]HLR66243.1 HesB/YadR/YfhF family protein [Virgibacillus sp.]